MGRPRGRPGRSSHKVSKVQKYSRTRRPRSIVLRAEDVPRSDGSVKLRSWLGWLTIWDCYRFLKSLKRRHRP